MEFINGLKRTGLCTDLPVEKEVLEEPPAGLPETISGQEQYQFLYLDAIDIAQKIGLGARINMIFKLPSLNLPNVHPVEDAVDTEEID
jgi:pyruvate-ferredoxin/flavodoxin oxidoreductase